MKDLYITNIQAGDKITGYFALRKYDLLEKDGRYRISAELGDSTGRLHAIMWDVSPEEGGTFQPGDIVKIRGPVSTYQGNLQIKIDRMRVASEDEYDIRDFFREASRTAEELSAGLEAMLNRLENNYLKQLMREVFDDTDLRKKYLEAPAAKLLHHDTIGGLADHSLNMAEIVVRMADQYPKLNRDLLICGALLHDVGKIWEFDVTTAIDYSDAGRLVGHINQGDEFICAVADRIEHFPDDLLIHLRHLIISHQGEKAKGSPVLPQTPEALFLHGIDELDSKMGAVEKIRDRTGDEGWSSFQQIFERFFFFGRKDAEE